MRNGFVNFINLNEVNVLNLPLVVWLPLSGIYKSKAITNLAIKRTDDVKYKIIRLQLVVAGVLFCFVFFTDFLYSSL